MSTWIPELVTTEYWKLYQDIFLLYMIWHEYKLFWRPVQLFRSLTWVWSLRLENKPNSERHGKGLCITLFSECRHLYSIGPNQEWACEKKRWTAFFRALCFCAAPRALLVVNLWAFQKGAGVLTFAVFQATNHILDRVGLTSHPGNQEKMMKNLFQCLSVRVISVNHEAVHLYSVLMELCGSIHLQQFSSEH